ncbi:DMT family transporter [Marilutibacter chinensis]|uniref:DMT family transporter n=1 Tax=Marilutibacter chinensis TaxID=2912247 RepID=A0ABS9HRG9_9GAMM|nr:DMT family transporter [Lysobacter chinensis]MCF7220727.1 DMT family transporter [Lysobacter chinensis]
MPRNNRSAPLSTYASLALGMAVFGSGTPVSKLVTSAFPVFLGSGLRMALAALVLLPFVLADRRNVRRFDRRDWLLTTAIAAIGMFGFSVFMLFGMQQVSGVVGSVVMSTTPAVTALGAFVFLRERLGWIKAAAVALAVAGVLVLQLGGKSDGPDGGGNPLVGMLLVFGAVCSEAAYTLLGKRASEHARPVTIAGLAAIIATLLFLPFAIHQWPDFEAGRAMPRDWIALGWWGAGTMALGSVLWYRGVSKVPGGTAAGFMGVMPVSALLLSYLLLGEPFVWIHLIGFAIVFASVLLIAREHARESSE